MSANIDKERAAFEAWALTCDGNCSDRNLIKYADDSPFKDEATYANRLVERDWIVWQAARATPSPAPIQQTQRVDIPQDIWEFLAMMSLQSGGMLNGNHVSRRAKELLAAPQQPGSKDQNSRAPTVKASQ